MGELVYQLKYRNDPSAVDAIVALLDAIGGIETYDLIVPIPATKKRSVQPLELVATALGARRRVRALLGLLRSAGGEELKDVTDPVARSELLRAAMKLTDAAAVAGKKVLVVDDLYRSGATLTIATELLYREGMADAVSVLALTMTRSNR